MKVDGRFSELIGAIYGDGHIKYFPNNHHYAISIYGHKTDDRDYLIYLQKLVKQLFNKETNFFERKNHGAAYIDINSKEIVESLLKLGIKSGASKRSIGVPSKILNSNKENKRMFLRGLMDTDGCLIFGKKGTYKKYVYPVIEIKIKNKHLIEDSDDMLKQLGFGSYVRKRGDGTYCLYLSGAYQLEKWIKEIGFSNPKHYTKYELWKKEGEYTPKTTLAERRSLLKSGGSKVVMHPFSDVVTNTER